MRENTEYKLGESPKCFSSIELNGRCYENSEFGYIGRTLLSSQTGDTRQEQYMLGFKIMKACTVIIADEAPRIDDFQNINISQYIVTKNGIWYFDCSKKCLISLEIKPHHMMESLLLEHMCGIPFADWPIQKQLNTITEYTGHSHALEQKGAYLLLPDSAAYEEGSYFKQWMDYCNSLQQTLRNLQKLHFRIQNYQFTDTVVHTSTKKYSMPLMLVDSFEATCERYPQHPLLIFHPLGAMNNTYTTGRPHGKYNFINILENSQNQKFVQEMFAQLIKEYAIAYIFDFPIPGISYFGRDSAVVFEIRDQGAVPKAGYMLWHPLVRIAGGQDLPMGCKVNEFRFKPVKIISTLEDFTNFKLGLDRLSLMVAEAIVNFTGAENWLADTALSPLAHDLTNNITAALEDDIYLKKALQEAAAMVEQFTGKSNIATFVKDITATSPDLESKEHAAETIRSPLTTTSSTSVLANQSILSARKSPENMDNPASMNSKWSCSLM